MNNTLTTWRFLIKAPYLGKLSHFSSDENKGLQSIAETTYYRQCSINKTGHIMLKPFSAHAPQAFVWLLDLYGESLNSNPFRTQIFKNITDLGRGILKKRQQFLFLISTLCRL